MSTDSHARDDHDRKNDNNAERQGPAARKSASVDGTPRIESASAETEIPGSRPPPVSSGLISLCVVCRPAPALGGSSAAGSRARFRSERGAQRDAAAISREGARSQSQGRTFELEPPAKQHAACHRGVEERRICCAVALRRGRSLYRRRPAPAAPQRLDREQFEAIWSGKLLLIKSRLRLDNPNRPFDLSWFIPAIWKYRKILGEILAASFVIQLFGLTTPLFTQVIIDKVLMHKSISTLHVLAAGMLIMITFEAILTILKTHLMAHTSNRIDVALGARLFRHLLHIPLRYFEVRRVGDTVARVRELENIRQFITGSSINVILDLVFTVLFVAVMFLYSGILTCVTLACIPLFVVLSVVIRPIMRRRLEEKFDRGAENQSYLVEAVTGVQTVKAMALEPIFYRRWEEQLARYVTASFRTSHLSGIAGAMGQIIQKLSTLSILWVGAYLVMRGSLTVGQLIAFQMLSGRVISPILRVVQLWQDFQQVGISVERLGDLINTKAEPSMNPSKMSLPAIQGGSTT